MLYVYAFLALVWSRLFALGRHCMIHDTDMVAKQEVAQATASATSVQRQHTSQESNQQRTKTTKRGSRSDSKRGAKALPPAHGAGDDTVRLP